MHNLRHLSKGTHIYNVVNLGNDRNEVAIIDSNSRSQLRKNKRG